MATRPTRVFFVAVTLLLIAAFVILWIDLRQDEPTREELTARIAASTPQWANYPEDIKAQIGAQSVASWAGHPVAAMRADSALEVTFRLTGRWGEENHPGMPILLRDPFGNELQSDATHCNANGEIVYAFRLDEGSLNAAFPWVEIMYPHDQRQLTFSREGTWSE